MAALNLFDSTMQFRMPPDSEIALLPAEAQERFNAVREADAKLGAAIAHREDVERRIAVTISDQQANDEELKSLRPRWTATDEAKSFIASERRQREREGF